MKALPVLLLASTITVAACSHPPSTGNAKVDELLQQLKSQDTDTRQNAMQQLQTSPDPRIPEACLPVLQMEGNSIRRQAARAIGSRWKEIPKERIPVFTAALKAQLNNEHDGLVNMARRGIALLNRNYSDAMVSQSHSKRWVIYERYGLPCLIDTQDESEELLGYGSGANLISAWGNTEVAPAAIWHPVKDMLALDIIENRKLTAVWIWVHGKGLRQLREAELVRVLKHTEDEIAGAMGFFTQITGWQGDALDFKLCYSIQKGDNTIEHEARLCWDSTSNKLSVLSDQVVP